MSIYPVKINEWFRGKEIALDLIKMIIKYDGCCVCGGKVSTRGYILHSAPYGGSRTAWCSKKCLYGLKK